MKKISLFTIFCVILLTSCNNKQNAPTAPYQPGQEVEFSVVANGDGFNNNARHISGSYNTGNYVNFSWNWGPAKANKEEMIVEVLGNTDPSTRQLFTMTANNPTTGVATFKGNLPSNYTSGMQLRVIAGNITDIDDPNPPIPSTPCFSGIDENMMRLEDTISSIDEQIELKAVWSVFRVPILFDPIDNEGYKLTEYGQSITVHYHINKIVTSGNFNGSPFSYTYNVPENHHFDYTTTPKVEQSYNIYAQLITTPGTYSDLSFDVEFDLSQCSVVGWNLITTPAQKSTMTFDASGTSYTISKNKCFYTPLADCFYKFNQ